MSQLKKMIAKLLDEGSTSSTEKARKILVEQATNSDLEAQLLLVNFILEYETEDLARALKWLIQAAKNKSGYAAYCLYGLYGHKDYAPVKDLQPLITPNAKESITWLDRALELGYFAALWERASISFENKDFEHALQLVKDLKKIKGTDFPEEDEALGDIKQQAREMEAHIKEQQKLTRGLELAQKDMGSLKPVQLYNLAMEILDSDLMKAKQFLKMASDKGLVQASKKLADLNKTSKK